MGDTAISTWLLDFGDGLSSNSSGNSIFHQYDSCDVNNEFIAAYTITDDNGCIDVDSIEIEVYCPTFFLAKASTVAPSRISFIF